MKNNAEFLFAGTILAIAADMDIDEILCMRLKGAQGRYLIITYEEAVYSQLDKHHVGKILLAREITPQELKAPGHANLWERYRRDRPASDESMLLYTEMQRPLRMFLHVMNDNIECLVVAGGLEIRYEPSGQRRYWEVGYRYTDLAFGAVR